MCLRRRLLRLDQRTTRGSAAPEARHYAPHLGARWRPSRSLAEPEVGDFAGFGYSLAARGNTLLVGAYAATIGANAYQGAVYVYQRQGSEWTRRARLTPADGTPNEFFGYSVALHGNTALVGAYLARVVTNGYDGAAYVFTGEGSSWAQQAKLVSPGTQLAESFGNSVALWGNTALVGAPTDDGGSVYAFERSGTTWAQVQKFKSPNASDGARQFGFDVALSHTAALIGDRDEQKSGDTSRGGAYLFARRGSGWESLREMEPSADVNHDAFGAAVSLSEDTALVGALGATVDSKFAQGLAFAFGRNESSRACPRRRPGSRGFSP